jgi:hypothetical protein
MTGGQGKFSFRHLSSAAFGTFGYFATFAIHCFLAFLIFSILSIERTMQSVSLKLARLRKAEPWSFNFETSSLAVSLATSPAKFKI